SVMNKFRGGGDCGTLAAYAFDAGDPELKTLRAKAACDGRDAGMPERWPRSNVSTQRQPPGWRSLKKEGVMRFDRTAFFNGYRSLYGLLKQTQVDGLQALLMGIEQDADVTDVRWAAYMLATIKHECDDTWQPVAEKGPPSYFDQYNAGT